MIASIGAGFLSSFFSQSKVVKKPSKYKKEKDWLEKSFDRKSAPIEVIM